MSILSICSNPEVLEVMKIVNIVILGIKILIPIVLILVGMIDMTKAITEKEEEGIKKAQLGLVRKAIAAVIIFLVPSFVNLIVRLVAPNTDYLSCLGMRITTIDIQEAYENKSSRLVSKAEQTNSYTDYSLALASLSKVENSITRKDFEERLKVVYDKIEAKKNENNNSSSGNNNSSTDNNTSQNSSGNIFIGDSRTNGIKLNVSLPSSDKVYAKDNANKSDFLNHASEVKSFLNSSPNQKYNIVLNYGVNDLHSDYCTLYKDFINSIDSKHNIYVVSVNPVNDNISIYAKNSNIVSFNQKIKTCMSSISNVSYCDVYNKADTNTWNSTYISTDGIHYTKEGYKFIHSSIVSCIK